MEVPEGTEQPVTDPVEGASGPSDNQGESTSSGGNPAWETLRSKLDPISFSKIEDDLRGWDKSAETRIASVNQKLSGYEKLGSLEKLQTYASLAQRIDAEPEVIYDALGKFLQKTGRMPSKQELETVVENEEQQPTENPELAEIRAQQQRITEFFEQQREEQNRIQAENALNDEIEQLRQAHKDFTDEDVQEVIMRAAFAAQRDGKKVPTLEEAAAEYVEKVRNRILSTPRPGDSAPRLLPTSGGGTGSTESVSLGKMSSNDIQSLVANLIAPKR